MSTTPAARRNVVRIIFLAVLFALAGVKLSQNVRLANAEQLARAQTQELLRQANADHQALVDWLRSREYPDTWTRADLQAHLPDHPELSLTPTGVEGRGEAIWNVPEIGGSWKFTFGADGKLMGWMGSSGAAIRPIIAPRSALFTRGEDLRRFLVEVIPWLWIPTIVAFPLARRRYSLLADVLAALALVYAAAQILSPLYSLSTIFSNDGAYLGGLMSAVSLAAVAATTPGLNAFTRRMAHAAPVHRPLAAGRDGIGRSVDHLRIRSCGGRQPARRGQRKLRHIPPPLPADRANNSLAPRGRGTALARSQRRVRGARGPLPYPNSSPITAPPSTILIGRRSVVRYSSCGSTSSTWQNDR